VFPYRDENETVGAVVAVAIIASCGVWIFAQGRVRLQAGAWSATTG
jgi:hypothetical protein